MQEPRHYIFVASLAVTCYGVFPIKLATQSVVDMGVLSTMYVHTDMNNVHNITKFGALVFSLNSDPIIISTTPLIQYPSFNLA